MAIGCWIGQGIPEKSCGFIQWAVGWRAVPYYYVRDRSSEKLRNRKHLSFTPTMFDMFCLGQDSSSENCCQISFRQPLGSPLKAWDCCVSLPFSRSSPCYLRASWTRRCLVIRCGRSQSISIASLCFWVNLSYGSSGLHSKNTPFSLFPCRSCVAILWSAGLARSACVSSWRCAKGNGQSKMPQDLKGSISLEIIAA